ncbi:hypothetical protein [Deinococcus aquatilis]|uniref:hypothetical protein n=1 Tax=Deinococcus aquatilis TaxID=519440 RepID=UPI0012FC2E97|nr:hypothetical protein [Deinococcus aquatilis]
MGDLEKDLSPTQKLSPQEAADRLATRLEKYRSLTQGVSPEEAADKLATQGVFIGEIVYTIFKLFKLPLSEAKGIGEIACRAAKDRKSVGD